MNPTRRPEVFTMTCGACYLGQRLESWVYHQSRQNQSIRLTEPNIKHSINCATDNECLIKGACSLINHDNKLVCMVIILLGHDFLCHKYSHDTLLDMSLLPPSVGEIQCHSLQAKQAVQVPLA